jgi:lambda family phage portal protein
VSRLLGWILGEGGGAQAAQRAVRQVRASAYDIARTSNHNERHWQWSDPRNAIEVITPETRRIASMRARYELRNNAWLAGMVRTKANDAIGEGPRLRINTDDRSLNQRIDHAWDRWSKSVRLALKLRTALMAKMVDGEIFATPINNSKVRGPIILDLRLINAGRVGPQLVGSLKPNEVDGIIFDEDFSPSAYIVEDLTPMSLRTVPKTREIAADRMMHWYRPESPEQIRGISEIAPSLGLFADLRRYREATLAAAETAANYAGVIKTDQPPSGEAEVFDAFDSIELEARSMLTLPAGWEIQQMDAKYPATNYKEFIEVLINEAARSLLTPFNVAMGNSASYNYASGRLDFQTYYRELGIERDDCETAILDPLLAEFIREAAADPQLKIPASMRDAMVIPHKWFWPGLFHADPVKEAQASKIRLESRLTTLSREYAADGLDWLEEIAQTEVEEEELTKRGLTRFAVPPSQTPANAQQENADA